MRIAAYTLTPMFVCGVLGFYPNLWLDMILGCAAAGYAIYLLYIGVPIVMRIPAERGFLFASAMVGVGLVGCATLLGVTVILWEMGDRTIRLTSESAMQIMALFYLAMLVGTGVLGFMVHWMSETYSQYIDGK